MSAQPNNGAQLPLSGIVVLDLTLARAGPTCVRHLADWGADVIRVEPPVPAGEDVIGRRHGTDFQNLHRNKRTIQLDLKSERGHAVFMRLVERADILVENMRAPVKDRLNIGWDVVCKVNPRLIYGSISGFGQTGPYRERGGVDQIAQGLGGLMSVTWLPGQGPVRLGIPINDLCAGSFLALAIVMALFDRTRTGNGRWVHTSLLESQIFMLDFQAARYLMKGEVAGQAGNDHPTGTPTGVFPTSDGHMNIAASATRLWLRLCDVLGKPEWKDKKEWSTQIGRTKDRAALNQAIADVTRHKPAAHWWEAFEAAGIPAGPINTIDKVFDDPQVQHLGIGVPVTTSLFGDTRMVGSPLNFEGLPRDIRSPTPEAGAHTDEVLTWLGYSSDEMGQLRAAGVTQPTNRPAHTEQAA
jgi:crotonobetainyl-CoA:carnitine CoA-transferase CaiB-like acyl-CoA transferase